MATDHQYTLKQTNKSKKAWTQTIPTSKAKGEGSPTLFAKDVSCNVVNQIMLLGNLRTSLSKGVQRPSFVPFICIACMACKAYTIPLVKVIICGGSPLLFANDVTCYVANQTTLLHIVVF